MTDIRDTQVYRETKRRLETLEESTKCDRARCIGMLDSEFADHYRAQREALDALFQESTK